jgi:lysozyme
VTTSPNGIALIKSCEGCKLQAYQDGAGIWTIGWGHTRGVKDGDVCTQEQADAWLVEDVAEAGEAPVNSLVKVPLNQNQFDACVSFCYNEGAGRLQKSTLLKTLNAGAYSICAAEFPKWDIIAGQASAGLLKRRLAEQALFLEPVS